MSASDQTHVIARRTMKKTGLFIMLIILCVILDICIVGACVFNIYCNKCESSPSNAKSCDNIDTIFESTFCMLTLIIPTLVILCILRQFWLDRKVNSHMKDLIEHQLTRQICPDSDKNTQDNKLWKCLTGLVRRSWKYPNQAGRDAQNLNNSSVDVNAVFAVQNNVLWHKYIESFTNVVFCDDRSVVGPSPNGEPQRHATPDLIRHCVQATQHSNEQTVDTCSHAETEGIQATNGFTCETNSQPNRTLNQDELQKPHRNVYLTNSKSTSERDNSTHESHRNHLEASTTVVEQGNIKGDTAHTPGNKPGTIKCDTTQMSGIIENGFSVELTRPGMCDLNEEPLPLRAGEAWLLHGTRIKNVRNILEEGFQFDRSRSNSLYGKGMYFTDSSQKADQYADDQQHRREKNLALIVVRVLLGSVGTYEQSENADSSFDTVVAGNGKRFLEYVKTDSTHCYPAFVVIYNRSNKPWDTV